MSTKTIVSEIGKLTVVDLANLIKELEETFGVSAATPVAAAAPAAASGAPAAAVEEKTEFKVTLKDSGAEKIKVIKALRSVTTKSLTEAKEMVESAPSVIADTASKEDAHKIKEALEAAGAKVELS